MTTTRIVPFSVRAFRPTPRRHGARDPGELAEEIRPLVVDLLIERGAMGANKIIRCLFGGLGIAASPSDCKLALDVLADDDPDSSIERRASDRRFVLIPRP
jgi:hypothetical protein